MRWLGQTLAVTFFVQRVTPFFMRWLREVVWLLQFEPTWFGEFGLAIGAIGWGLGANITDDLAVIGWDHALPIAAIVFGVIRCGALLRLWYPVRVVLASASALLWAWLFCGLLGRYGVVPMMGLCFGAFLIDFLTAAKFSIPCAYELWGDAVARRHAQ